MSFFIVACTASAGFRLMPPESYITPLPTRVTRAGRPPGPSAPSGVYSNLIIRAGSALPAFTPSRPPQPIATSCSWSYTSTARPVRPASAVAHRAISSAVSRLGGELARSRDSIVARANSAPRRAPRRAASRSASATSSVSASTGTACGERFSDSKR